MKKGAIFDQDGLMFDTEAIFSLAWAQAAKQLNVKLPEGFRTAVSGSSGEGTRQIIRTFVPDADPDTLMKLTFQISYGIQSHTLPEKPGLHEILEFFRAQGVKMAVASSSHRDPIHRNLERSGIRPYFDAVISGEDVSRGKPNPDAFLLAAQRLGLNPGDCYVFEDSFNGVRAGHAAGCFTVMIPDLLTPDQEIAKYYDACYPNLLTALGKIRDGTI
jgi:HAD superfamily hydrolase (TIGR01509 family)